MRFSPFVLAIAGAGLLFTGLFLSPYAVAQEFGDVTVKKNPDGSIETYDSSDGSAAAPRGRSRSSYKRSTQKYKDGVVVRKNADGSIETFDSGFTSSPRRTSASHASSHSVSKYSDGAAVKKSAHGSIETSGKSHSSPAGSQASSNGVHKFVHKYSKGVTVKKNPDGTIEVIGFRSDVSPAGGSADLKSKEKSHSSSKSSASGKAGPSSKAGSLAKEHTSAKAGVASRTPRRTARKPRGHGNFGDVRVIRNPDGSIETYDAN